VTTSPSYWWHEAGIFTCAEDVGTAVVPNILNTCVRVPAAKCCGWRSQSILRRIGLLGPCAFFVTAAGVPLATVHAHADRGSLQLRVLRLGFAQDGNVGIGVFPERKEILVSGAGFLLVAQARISTGLTEYRE
jgi:hypothetical protein